MNEKLKISGVNKPIKNLRFLIVSNFVNNKNIILISLIIVTLLSGCAEEKSSKAPIKIGTQLWAPYSYIHIADVKGYFREEGVNVELSKAEYTDTIMLYKEKKLDGAFFVFMDNFALLEEGIESNIVVPTEYTFGADSLVGKPEFKAVEDLMGRKIGIDGINTFSHFLVLKILENDGLYEGDVFFKNVPAEMVPQVLDDGLIDAGHTFEPGLSEAIAGGYVIIGGTEELSGLIIGGLNFHKKIVEERPGDIQKIVNAWFKAKEFARTNEEEATKIMADAHGLSVDEFKTYFNGLKVFDLEESKDLFDKSKTPSIYDSLLVSSEFLSERGQISQKPNIDELISPQFVNNIK